MCDGVSMVKMAATTRNRPPGYYLENSDKGAKK